MKAGRSVYFSSLADIVASLAKAERDGALRERIRYFCRFALLIVDEIGYLPVVPGGGNLFFQLVNARYEKGAMILTSNRGFAEWGEIFGDSVVATALLDRLLHHAVVLQIEGSSYRLREHADLLPEHIRAKANIQTAAHPADPAATRPAAKKRRSRSHAVADPRPRQTGEFYFGAYEENKIGIYNILYSPSDKADFFCFEPVTHPVDGHNLPGGPEANGLTILAPRETLSAACRFLPEAPPARPSPGSAPDTTRA